MEMERTLYVGLGRYATLHGGQVYWKDIGDFDEPQIETLPVDPQARAARLTQIGFKTSEKG
jgi:hypothetical protein